MNAKEILLVGVGTAGSRAAYYVYQRGSINGVTVLSVDTNAEALAMLPNVETLLAPQKSSFYDRELVSREGELFRNALKRHLDTTKLVIVVTCLGRDTGNFYTEEVVRQASEAGRKTAVIAAMPHSFDDSAWSVSARECRDRLVAIANTVLPLPCAEFGDLFPDTRTSEAYPQAVRWIAETAIGFASLFTAVPEPGRVSKPVYNEKDNQLYLAFKDLPRGIFVFSKPTFCNGEDLDVPTFIRRKIPIDDGR